MYQEENNSFQWLKLILRLVIVLLVVLLTLRFVFIISSNSLGKKDTTFDNNLKYIDNISKGFFNEKNIPKVIGESKEYKIEDVLSKDQIDYMNKNYNKIDYENSYIKVTRLENEYQIKTLLTYNGETNYINSFVNIEKENTTIKVSTTKIKTTKKKVTTKAQTTTKKFKVSFNTNGGEFLDDIYVKANTKVTIIPKREGYEFIGWYYNGEKFTKGIDANYTLVAKWIKK